MDTAQLSTIPARSPVDLPHSLEWHKRAQESRPEYAGFRRRYIASFIDGFLVGLIARIAVSLTGIEFGLHVERAYGDKRYFVALNSTFILAIAIGWLYHASFESSSRQATFGKGILGVVVTDLENHRISFGRASARYFASFLSYLALLIGYLIQPFTWRRQALHDLIACTLVVKS